MIELIVYLVVAVLLYVPICYFLAYAVKTQFPGIYNPEQPLKTIDFVFAGIFSMIWIGFLTVAVVVGLSLVIYWLLKKIRFGKRINGWISKRLK